MTKKKKPGGTARLQVKKQKSAASDEKLRQKLREIHRWEMISGPHSIGLANLQTWVTAYTMDILTAESEEFSDPTGVITS